MGRWKELGMLDNHCATATRDLLQQDLCYGAAAVVEVETLERRPDMAPSLVTFSSHI